MKKCLIALCLILTVFLSSCGVRDKPEPKFDNGEMVIHTLSERVGQVIDNSYSFDSKAKCWKVNVRFKSGVKEEKSIADKIGRMIDDKPILYHEFELERQ
jgi:major membrane immunogen (membrane-anchored lipoprotein)